jgi:hypothetical protein
MHLLCQFAYCTPITPLHLVQLALGDVGTVQPHPWSIGVIINGFVPLFVKTPRFPLEL